MRLLRSLSIGSLLIAVSAHAGEPLKASRIGLYDQGRVMHAVGHQTNVQSKQAFADPFGDDVPKAGPSTAPPVPAVLGSGVTTAACLEPATCCDTCGSNSCSGCDTTPTCAAGCGSGTCSCGAESSLCSNSCLGDLLGPCCLGDPWTLSGHLHGDCPPAVTVGGWFSLGYHSESNGIFNDRPDELNLHQAWLTFERAADADENPLGFRADILYGIDAANTQAFGNNPGTWDFQNGYDHGAYGWAIPQLYLELALGEWTFKAGHFFTLVGYEVVPARDNFFYSHAMTMNFSEPFTHTGVVGSRKLNEDIEIFAGWTLGWDTGFDQLDQGSSWLGGASFTLTEDAVLTYISTAGNFGWRGRDAYSHSVVLDMTVTESLNWVVQSDMVRVDSTGEDNVGLNQYLLYTVNDCLSLGTRLEWWKGDVLTGYAPHGGTLPASGSLSYYGATLGANYRPSANVILRPEYRFDWSPAADYDQGYVGIDAIITF